MRRHSNWYHQQVGCAGGIADITTGLLNLILTPLLPGVRHSQGMCYDLFSFILDIPDNFTQVHLSTLQIENLI